MNLKNYFFMLLCFVISSTAFAQNAKIYGKVTSNGEPLPDANVYIGNTSYGTVSSEDGSYYLSLPEGVYNVRFELVGYKPVTKIVDIDSQEDKSLNVDLDQDLLGLEQVVVSATRNRVNLKKAPVVVNVLTPKLFNATRSISVADGLNYQPGVRVETNCQNCNFTQVRLNGLEGGYTQILINSRPVFSALNGVYGLEQIPTSMLDRIEVVRSGGSALYGSNAIAGTVNIITKDPVINSWEVGSNFAMINDKSFDRVLNMNASVVSEDLKSGVTVFGMHRDRDSFDANDDGFTEMTELVNTSVGAKAFYKPTDLSRLSIDLAAIEEFRRGGDKLDLAPHFTDITEQLEHDTFIGGLTYDIYNESKTNHYSFYTSTQHTKRKSYYGGLGGKRGLSDSIAAANAYGTTKDLSFMGGGQFTHNFGNNDVLTTGVEYTYNDTNDEIKGYHRYVDQNVKGVGVFAQYEWKPIEDFTALIGGRFDNINLDGKYGVESVNRESNISQNAFSPRLTLMYSVTPEVRLRGGYARGFRAPQAFNEDLHIASVGGEASFVILGKDLKPETSDAYTLSFNYAKDFNKVQTNFLVEGFYTDLQNKFTETNLGSINGINLSETRNSKDGATVIGTNVELGVSPSPRLNFQLGGTIQKSQFKQDEVVFDEEVDENTGKVTSPEVVSKDFMRTPDFYGYFNTNVKIFEETSLDVTGTYTGSMKVKNGTTRDIRTSPSFFNMNLQLSHHFDLTDSFHVTINAGVQNVFDSYQKDFDKGPERDSEYIYGPSQPRTFFIGLRFGNLH